MKRIGLDARVTRQLSVGMRGYVRELSARLPRVAPEFAFARFERGGNFGFDEQIRLPLWMRRARLALTHYLSLYVPLISPTPSIVTIHDLIHLRFPEYFKAKVGPYYATVVRYACARARRVVTDDERTVDDLERLLHVDRRKVRVVPLGVDDAFLRPTEPYRAPRPYLLYVGNHRAHKNLATLLEAWSQLAPHHAVDLYVTGPDDFAGELQRRSNANRQAIALGDVDVAALAAYYAGARALVQPSLAEGFGLPMLEAMAVGTPVVASQDAVPGVLAEVALRFPARDHRALLGQLEKVLSDQGLRAHYVEEGQKTARALTWDRCARATADVYREVLEA